MDENESLTESAAADESAPSEAPKRTRRWLRTLIAIIVIVLILAAAAWFGWRWWQRQAAPFGRAQTAVAPTQPAAATVSSTPIRAQAQDHALANLGVRIDQMETELGAAHDQHAAVKQALASHSQGSDALRAQTHTLSQRVIQLEGAVARLSRQRLSAHDAMLLDDAEMLLRLGQQRYRLFRDGQGALKAYALAAQTLGAIRDPMFADLRQAVEAERAQLAATQPAARQSALAALQRLRAQWPDLPLKPLDGASADDATPSAWQRAWHALANVIRIDRVPQGGVGARDPAMARQLGRLDLAQAQAALLAADSATSHAALQRAQSIAATRLDPDDAAVQQATAVLDRLLKATAESAPPVHLGAALEQLEDLRAIHALAPAGAASSAARSIAPIAPPITPAPTPTPAPAPAASVAPAADSGTP